MEIYLTLGMTTVIFSLIELYRNWNKHKEEVISLVSE